MLNIRRRGGPFCQVKAQAGELLPNGQVTAYVKIGSASGFDDPMDFRLSLLQHDLRQDPKPRCNLGELASREAIASVQWRT